MDQSADRIFREFLNRQYDEGTALAADSDILKLMPMNGPASDHYMAEFNCRGLIQNDGSEIVEFNKFAVGIWFPEDYLRTVDLQAVLTYLGPAPRPWHPNLLGPTVCLHITPGTELVSIL